jgi:hypothetical protein
MARIFSIQFFYKESLQNAMVSVRETAFYTEYQITMLDDFLKSQLPSDKIISTAQGHFAFANVLLQNYTGLMKEIIAAISGHIHSLQH